MNNKSFERLQKNLEELKNGIEEKQAKQLNLKLVERVVKRLGEFSGDCKECEKLIGELNNHIINLKNKRGQFEKIDRKQHRDRLGDVIGHLQKEHKLVNDGYYMSVYMLIGSGIGIVFGLLVFNNMGLGLPIGLSIGVGIGAALDAASKKKGMTI